MTHPIVACASDIRASLKGVASVNPTFMTTDDKATALGELVRAEAQLVELRLRVLADAGDLAVATAARDAAGWLARMTRTRFADARADLVLATALDREHPVLAAAMREGDVDPGAGAGDPPSHRRTPVERGRRRRGAGRGAPRRPGGRVRSEGARPPRAPDPRRGRPRDRRRGRGPPAGRARGPRRRQRPGSRCAVSGDGTTRISGRVPDAAATRFATYLEAVRQPPQAPGSEPDDAVRRIRSRDCRTRSGSGKHSAGSWSPSTRPGSRSTAVMPPP